MTVTPADRGPQLLGTTGFFLALSTVTVLARCYCRTFIVKSFGFDDWCAVIAWVFFVFFSCFAILGVYHGTGQHATALPPTEIPVGLKWWWACEPVYVLSNMFLKLSIGLMLLRLAVDRTHRIIIYVTVAFLEVYGAAYFLLFVLQCRPSAYFWTRYTGGEGSCINPDITVNATYVYSAISCAADWTLAILPIFIIRNIQMNIRTKIVVGMILAMGAIASTATIIRIPYVQDLANQADFLYATTDVTIWSTSETGIGIAACCIATLRPFFRTFFSRSRLLGGNSGSAIPANPSQKPWANSNGYIRSHSKTSEEPIRLRDDISGPNTATVIGAGDLERGNNWKERKGSGSGLTKFGWDDSEDDLVEGKERKISMQGGGITKTTVSTRTEERR